MKFLFIKTTIIDLIAIISIIFMYTGIVHGAELKPKTLSAWQKYQELTEKRIISEIESGTGFLVQDFMSSSEKENCLKTISEGGIYIKKMKTLTNINSGKSIKVPKGMIHHWMGCILVPGANFENLLVWIQNYDQHEKYFPEVERSRLISRNGDVFEIFLRLKRKKIVTVYYNTEHHAEYYHHDIGKVSSKSYSTRISQIKEAGTPAENELPEGQDSGYLWRLNSYWRFQKNEKGVIIECESISLSRSIPPILNILIQGYVKSIAKESLENTLISIRDGYSEF